MRQTALFILIVLCFAVFAVAQTAILSPPSSRIIVKFKSGSQSLAAARIAAPLSEAESANLAEPRHAALASALSGSGIARIRAVKPDAGLQPLAGGMERLFIADLAPGVALADAVRSLSSNPDVECAVPDYVLHATGSTPIKLQQQAAGGPPGFSITPSDLFFPNSGRCKIRGRASLSPAPQIFPLQRAPTSTPQRPGTSPPEAAASFWRCSTPASI
jgi:hypothetical protein